jgi:hypothetical protein
MYDTRGHDAQEHATHNGGWQEDMYDEKPSGRKSTQKKARVGATGGELGAWKKWKDDIPSGQ